MQLRALLLLAITSAACGGGGPASTCAAPDCTPANALYAAEVVSPTVGSAMTPLPSYDFAHVDLDAQAGAFSVALPTIATVTGAVLAGATPVPASIVFTRPSHIPGRPDVFYQVTSDADTGVYSLSVPINTPGERYSVRVQPNDGTSYPPLSETIAVSADQTLDFSMPSGSDLVTVTGKVTDALGAAVPLVSVVLRDAGSLVVLSTTTQTNLLGAFSLAIPAASIAAASGFQLLAQHGDTSSGLLSLTLPLSADDLAYPSPLGLALPALSAPTQLSLRVVGAGSNGTNQPVAGAQVQLVAALDDGSGSAASAQHEVDAQTDANGQIGVSLYTNTDGAQPYVVSIAPAAGSMFQSVVTSLVVGTSSGVSAPIQLMPRPLVTGRVLDPSGAPVSGAVVQPQLASVVVEASAATTSLATSATGTSDANGRFALYLDAGTYQLDIVPPPTRPLARQWLPARDIREDVELGDVTAPTAVMVDGAVTAQGMPVETTLRLYSLPAASGSCPAAADGGDGDCVQPPLLIAEGSTDAQGQATLNLPSSN